jgi:hypothetical protein
MRARVGSGRLETVGAQLSGEQGAVGPVQARLGVGSAEYGDLVASTITLPPFLVELLRAYLATHDHPHVFVSPDRQLYRRSNFSRRALRPAADGAPRRRDPNQRLPAVKPGLTFHGLRHSHKTWMIADNVPEIGQARRLGHTLDDKIQQTYSHVAAEVEHRLLDALTDRWDKAIADSPHQPTWRDIPGRPSSPDPLSGGEKGGHHHGHP